VKEEGGGRRKKEERGGREQGEDACSDALSPSMYIPEVVVDGARLAAEDCRIIYMSLFPEINSGQEKMLPSYPCLSLAYYAKYID
jgi:hypothetical protein